ncbi:nucleotidyltransferase family protein [uncultured Thiodictyon sp.]|uniref:nucleotidyltransferase family protein n=1 Tax=uncultured Thiodictyon sp. TaxID=1846217 RepID=UPI0025E300C6|nr:nucleotidyltransferase family protein [uncultured Thiodictyon sp.]
MTQRLRITRWSDLAALLDPGGQCADPRADGHALDWLGIYALAAAHLVAPTLYAVLAARGRLDAVPEAVCAALAELHRLNDARNARLRAVLRDTVRHLIAAGIEPLLLKGSIALLPDQYPQAAARMMGDLDLALVNAPAEQGEAVLRAAGYFAAPNVNPAHYTAPFHHIVPLFHPSGDGYVELHRAILAGWVPAQALPLARVCGAAQPVDWDGLRLWVPSLGHRLLHNALHHQVTDAGLYSGRRALRQLFEFAKLRALPGAARIDWPDLLAGLDRVGQGGAVRAYLLAGERLFGQPLPAGVRPGVMAYWSERLAWLRIALPRLGPQFDLVGRLHNLPRHLITPSWYPAKIRSLCRG